MHIQSQLSNSTLGRLDGLNFKQSIQQTTYFFLIGQLDMISLHYVPQLGVKLRKIEENVEMKEAESMCMCWLCVLSISFKSVFHCQM